MDGDPPLERRALAHRLARWGGLAVLAGLAVSGPASAEKAADPGLTAVAGVKVGHHTMLERPTGCTVVLTEAGAVGAVDVRGGAPGTRETDLLDPSNLVERVHAVVLAGGSAFGLDAAGGVVRYLEERGVGFDAGVARVPIVPAAILFDLPVGGDPRVRPTAECGYQAARSASAGPVAEGNVGAGAGATVGKLLGRDRAMKGGVGSAALAAGDLVVAALVAVNAAGDVVDPETGAVVAGVRTENGRGLVDVRTLIRSGALLRPPAPAKGHEHTTLGVVATSAALGKAEARKVAQMAHDGLARAVHPAHLPVDGDTLFVLATGASGPGADVGIVGAMAADVVARAVVRAVRAATGIPGYPAARDLPTAPDP